MYQLTEYQLQDKKSGNRYQKCIYYWTKMYCNWYLEALYLLPDFLASNWCIFGIDYQTKCPSAYQFVSISGVRYSRYNCILDLVKIVNPYQEPQSSRSSVLQWAAKDPPKLPDIYWSKKQYFPCRLSRSRFGLTRWDPPSISAKNWR